MRNKLVWFSLIIGVVVGLFMAPTAALAWTDIDNATWMSQYQVTQAQVEAVADGFPDDSFRPAATVTRGQFAKMVVSGLDIAIANPVDATFTDVPRGHIFYQYVEGGVAAGLIQGLNSTQFGPGQDISRQQVATILARYLSAVELDVRGYILGKSGTHYGTLAAWYAAEGADALQVFNDQGSIALAHRQGVAYLAALGASKGSNGMFLPLSSLTRGQAAALIVRVGQAADEFEPAPLVPTVTSISPTSGPEAGGTVVTINGANFTDTATVKFGDKAATSVTYVNATRLTAVAPSGSGNTTVDVLVTTAAGTSANTSADNYYYVSATAPTVTSLSPTEGTAAGGNTVTINGTNFTSTAIVKFGTKSATNVVFVSATKLTAVAPSGTAGTTVDVIVTTAQGDSANTAADNYKYLDITTPTITLLSPNHGPYTGGNSVVITGTNFPSDESDVNVYFGTKLVDEDDIVISSSSKMTVSAVPSGTAGQTVRVKIVRTDLEPDATSPDTDADNYLYDEVTGPYITSLSPPAGDEGDTIKINGGGFGTDEDEIDVWFGGKAATVSSVNSTGTQIQVVAPAGTGVVDVLVKVSGELSENTLADDFSYDEPAIDAIIPDRGPTDGGNTISIMGSGFVGTMKVYFDDKKIASDYVEVVSPTLIHVVAPEWDDEDEVDVKVVNAASPAEESNEVSYEFVDDLPVVTSLSKSAGDPDGGTAVTIRGDNFGNDEDDIVVYFGDEEADVIDVNSAGTEIDVESPAGEEGTTVDVIVEVDGTESADTPADDFAYGVPQVTELYPMEGDSDGGTEVYIYGTGFTSDVRVKFGDVTVPSEDLTVGINNDVIIAIAPEGDADDDPVHVTVRNDFGISDESDDDLFTYIDDLNDPVVTSISPEMGVAAGGTAVTIEGENFDHTATVKFGSAEARVIDYVSDTVLLVESPAGTADKTVSVRVTVDGNTSDNTAADDFYYIPNGDLGEITLAPAFGPITGGNTVVIEGDAGSFSAKPTVKINSTTVDADDVLVLNDSTVQVVMPSAASAKKVDITVRYGTSNVSDKAEYQYFDVEAQWRLATEEDDTAWDSFPSTLQTLGNGTAIDMRLVISDEDDSPLAGVNLAALIPWYYYSTTVDGAGPDSPITDENGALIWSDLGGLSDTTNLTFRVGFDYNESETFTSGEFYRSLRLKWD